MFPDPIFTVLGFRVDLYLLLQGVALAAPLWLALRLVKEEHASQILTVNVWFGCIAAAAVGGQLINWLLSYLIPLVPLYWSLGEIAAVFAFLFLLRFYHPKIRAHSYQWGDVAAPSLALAIVPARLACFAAGCCHGQPAEGLPWAVRFNNPHTACTYPGTPVHPVQLYEALGMLMLCIFLLAVRRRPWFAGRLMECLMIGFGTLRFVVEAYRGDVRPMWGEMPLSQVIALCIAFIGVSSFLLNPYVRAWSERRAAVAAS